MSLIKVGDNDIIDCTRVRHLLFPRNEWFSLISMDATEVRVNDTTRCDTTQGSAFPGQWVPLIKVDVNDINGWY